MVISSTAFIFYGVVIPNDTFLPWESTGEDWKECIAARLGLNPPNLKLKGNEDKFKEYWTKKNEALKALNVSIECIGNPKSFRYVIAIKESLLWASREFVQVIDKEQDFTVDIKWRNQLHKFCQLLEIPMENPNWYLGTYTDA